MDTLSTESLITAVPSHTLATPDLNTVDLWWRAANFLSVGQIYLLNNALLSRPHALLSITP